MCEISLALFFIYSLLILSSALLFCSIVGFKRRLDNSRNAIILQLFYFENIRARSFVTVDVNLKEYGMDLFSVVGEYSVSI